MRKTPETYFIETYGCQMNVRDSETIAGIFERRGMHPVTSQEEADVILFNTCCVRDNPERKTFGNVGFTKALKDAHPDMIIAVCGCMMQQRQVAEKLFHRFPFVDLVFGTNALARLDSMLDAVMQGERLCIVNESDFTVVEGLPSHRAGGQSAFVNIMYGCNNFCTYCIVPYVRGRERSRMPEDIEAEVRSLVAEGYSEITLLGQNVNSYGRGLPVEIDFPALLRRLSPIPGLRRLRFMTSHPKDLSDGLIDAMATLDNVCPHIHLPLQSGSDRILRAMNRHYTADSYLELCRKLREKVADVEITTDIIVGFPGETEEDFSETMRVVKAAAYATAYSFKYSPREGTPGAAMPDQIAEDVKSDRLRRLNQLLTSLTECNNRTYVGRTGEVLVEGSGERDAAPFAFGKLPNFKMIYFPGSAELVGRYVSVRVDEVRGNSLFGKLV